MSEAMQQEIGGLRRDISDLGQRVGGLEKRADGVERRLGGVENRLGVVESTLHGVAVTVSRHEEHFVRIEERLKKLDLLDQIKNTLDALAGEIKSSRDERTLSNKTFREQQATLTDHELRIVRLERNAKLS